MRTLFIIIGFVITLSFTSCARRVVVATPKITVLSLANQPIIGF